MQPWYDMRMTPFGGVANKLGGRLLSKPDMPSVKEDEKGGRGVWWWRRRCAPLFSWFWVLRFRNDSLALSDWTICETQQSSSSIDRLSMDRFPSSGEINRKFPGQNKSAALVLSHYQVDAVEIDHTDGLQHEYGHMVTSTENSVQEPLIRLNVETKAR